MNVTSKFITKIEKRLRKLWDELSSDNNYLSINEICVDRVFDDILIYYLNVHFGNDRIQDDWCLRLIDENVDFIAGQFYEHFLEITQN